MSRAAAIETAATPDPTPIVVSVITHHQHVRDAQSNGLGFYANKAFTSANPTSPKQVAAQLPVYLLSCPIVDQLEKEMAEINPKSVEFRTTFHGLLIKAIQDLAPQPMKFLKFPSPPATNLEALKRDSMAVVIDPNLGLSSGSSFSTKGDEGEGGAAPSKQIATIKFGIQNLLETFPWATIYLVSGNFDSTEKEQDTTSPTAIEHLAQIQTTIKSIYPQAEQTSHLQRIRCLHPSKAALHIAKNVQKRIAEATEASSDKPFETTNAAALAGAGMSASKSSLPDEGGAAGQRLAPKR